MGAIGEAFETIVEETEKGVQTAQQQITGKPANQQATNPQVAQQAQKTQQAAAAAAVQQPASDQAKPLDEAAHIDTKQPDTQKSDEKKSFLKGLYGETPEVTQAEVEQKKLEDIQKEERLRQQLHGQYYQKLTTPQQQPEERPQEKVEREEEEKKEALALEEEKKQKEELPIVVTKDMGTKEKLRGVSG